MTFEQFAVEQKKLSLGWFRNAGGFLGFAMLSAAVVMFFLLPVTEELLDLQGEMKWLPILTPVVLIMCSLVLSQTSNFIVNRRSKSRFVCQHCETGLNVAESAAVVVHNICPHCSQAAFACEESGEFVDVPENEVVRPAAETTDEPAAADSDNPYAPPTQSNQPVAADDRTGCLWLIPNYFVTTFNSIRHLVVGSSFTIAHLEALVENLGGEPLNEKFIEGTVRGFKRRAVLWLLIAVLAPILATMAVCFLPIYHADMVARTFITGGALLVATGVGALAYALVLSMAPKSLRRWFAGDTPPTVTELGEETGVYGIWFLFVDNRGVKFHQPSITLNYRSTTSGDVIFGLLNRESLREYRLVRRLEVSEDWREIRVSFTPSLQCVDADFRGDQIRLLPPREMVVEVETFNVELPQLPH